MKRLLVLSLLMSCVTIPVSLAATDEEIAYFETDIRPLLATNCFECHGPEEQEGELRLDHISTILKGGEYGPAIVPGKPNDSNLVEAINWSDPEFQMPPKKKLSDEDIAKLTKWVSMGAPWPDEPLPAEGVKKDAFDLAGRAAAHWAWQPVTNPDVPKTSDAAWNRNPVDGFVRARLDSEGLTPATRADKRTLIRRVYFDLIGLPPSPETVENFVNDDSSGAYDMVVDSLLANPAFGERWGRHWLDITRYAETYGHEGDYPIRHAWQYRDYVIRALNQDVPYDEFLREQIAGDLLDNPRINKEEGFNESIVGTGWWFMHQATHAPVDVVKDEADRIDNQIDVLSKAFLGMTVACARCHDHKFDAISTKDYYSMSGYLRSSRQQVAFLDRFGKIEAKADELAMMHDQSTKAVVKQVKGLSGKTKDMRDYLIAMHDIVGGNFDFNDEEKRKVSDETIAEVAEQHGLDAETLKEWVSSLAHGRVRNPNHPLYPWSQFVVREKIGTSAKAPDTVVYETFEDGSFGEWFVIGDAFGDGPTTQNEWSAAGNTGVLIPKGVVHSGRTSSKLRGVLRSPTFTLSHDTVHIRAAGTKGKIRLVIANYQLREYNALLFNDTLSIVNSRGNYDWITQINGLHKFKGRQAFIEIIDDNDGWIAVDEIRFSDQRAVNTEPLERLTALDESIDSYEALADAYVQWAKEGFAAWSKGDGDLATVGYLNFLLERNLVDRSKFDKKFSGIRQALIDSATDMPEPIAVVAMTQGTPEEPKVFIRGNHTTPGEPSPTRFLGALGARGPDSDMEGRLQLANEIVDPANPLTARVMVNRIWHHLFGRGIVESVDNFGVLGRKPTHPELLDHLATEFRDEGWSIKDTIRKIVTSETYAMASGLTNPEAEAKDPANILLHRQNVRRLEGEIIRDAVLAVAGQLNATMYGDSVPAHLYPFMTNHRRPGESGPVDADRRRSIYMRVQRNFLSPMMLAFDMPLPDTAIGKRTVSNVPAQSLIMMNDPFVAEQAEAWAKSLMEDQPDDADARINLAYQTAFGRVATEGERNTVNAFLDKQAKTYDLSNDEVLANTDLWKDLCQVLYMSKEFIYIG